MREYKFRGLDNNKYWRFGFLSYSAFETEFCIKEVADIEPTYQDPGGGIYSETTIVKPETVGQYTGLKDQNDKEIYVGDIIMLSAFPNQVQNVEIIGCVAYQNASWGVVVDRVNTWEKFSVPPPEEGQHIYFLNIINAKVYRVIGNIHENPELLTTDI